MKDLTKKIICNGADGNCKGINAVLIFQKSSYGKFSTSVVCLRKVFNQSCYCGDLPIKLPQINASQGKIGEPDYKILNPEKNIPEGSKIYPCNYLD